MSIAVPSRFACLNIDDDDFEVSTKSEKKKEKQQEKPNTKKVEKTKDNKKVTTKQNNKKEKKLKSTSDRQWEEWKQKDDEYVNGNFEQDLQSAILLSKLEYESKKDIHKKQQRENEKKNETKKKKPKTMSLDQFLGSSNQSRKDIEENNIDKTEKNDDFFEKVKLEAKEEYTKDKINENRKNREANIEEIISSAQYQEKLQIERQRNLELRQELEKLKIEIADVKKRNKTLCGILGHGEMKDKADVLMELERLNNMKNELTDEVAKLHVLLEQERSKVAALTSESQKVKDKRNK